MILQTINTSFPTDRDNDIAKHIEKHKYATIPQIEKIFMRDATYSYWIAARRLKVISDTGFAKIHRDEHTNHNIYIYNNPKEDIKPPTESRIIVLNVLAEMVYSGFNIELFKVEKFWLGDKVRSDAWAIFTIKKRRYHFFIEVQLAKHPHNLAKYDLLYDSGEYQKLYSKNHFPRVLFISDIDYSDTKIKSTEVLQLDTKLHMFPSILL
jgi:hypothetical protein